MRALITLAHTDIFEPIGPAVFLVKEGFAVCQAACVAAAAFRRVGAIEEWNMLIANVPEPAGKSHYQ